MKDKIANFIVKILPDRVIYWAIYRLYGHATTNQYSHRQPDEIGFSRLIKSWEEKLGMRKDQPTKIFCPKCGLELTFHGHHTGLKNGLEGYECSNCDTISRWNFDAPVPILISRAQRPENGIT